MKKHGPWTIIDSHNVYHDPWLRVQRDEVLLPDGSPGSYAIVHIKPGVSVMAMDEDQNIYLTSEFHYAVGKVTLETVSGGIENNETAEDAARRELAEELGIHAAKLQHYGEVDPFTASILSPTQLFLAEQLSFGEVNREITEQIEMVKMSLYDCYKAVMNSQITHAPSCALILKVCSDRLFRR